jgi:ubiquinone/menaquinone biosynthesis C-methylase UbiE
MSRRIYFDLLYLFSDPPWDTGFSPPELLEFIEKHAPGMAIDIGCGTGTNVITLAQAGWQVTGVDFAPHAIKIAKRKVRKAGAQAELLVRDATKLEGISGPFDLALDMGCFHGLRDKKADYLSELERILAPGGYWLMYGFYKPDPDSDAPGLVQSDLELIATTMSLRWRRDGYEKEERPSAWFLYQKPESDNHK